MLYNTTRQRWARVALAVLGSLIYSIGINYFVTPAGAVQRGLPRRWTDHSYPADHQSGAEFWQPGCGRPDLLRPEHSGVSDCIPLYLRAFRHQISAVYHLQHRLSQPADPARRTDSLRRAGFLDSGRHHCRRRHRPDALRRRLFRRHGYPGRISHEKSPGMSVGRINMAFNITLYIICLILFQSPGGHLFHYLLRILRL